MKATLSLMTDRNQKPVAAPKGKFSFLNKLGISARAWARENVAPIQEINESSSIMYGAGVTTVASLLGRGKHAARARQIIYEKWMFMEHDPIISSAVKLLVTAALGGHETTGDLVFIEPSASAKEDKKLEELVADMGRELGPLFNRVAFQMAYTAACYGDAFARVYCAPGKGVVDLDSTELVRPQLVQAYERGSRTVGYSIYIGERNFEKLDVTQMARMKMPRQQWVPQYGVVEKSYKVAIREDDLSKLPIMPSLVGGSLLYNAEDAYENLLASLLGLVGQRWQDALDEQIIAVNMESMTAEQKAAFLSSIKAILTRSKEYAENAVRANRPIMEKIRHIIPVHNEKQVFTLTPMQAGRSGAITIDDIMLHARLLAGALGVDLSLIGFADQLAGGLGEGGFFRVSAQAAETARVIRVALAEFFSSILDIHTLKKYGMVFDPVNRPWTINFYGSISALEAEKQRTRQDAMNAGMVLVQAMQQMKDLGASKEIMEEFLEKTMLLDEDQAKLYAKIVEQPSQGEGEAPGMMPDGMGGDDGGDAEEWGEEDPPKPAKKSPPPVRAKKTTVTTSTSTAGSDGGA